MTIAVQSKDDVAILLLSGKFLAGTAGPDLRQKVKDLPEAGVRQLIVDFGEVPYIDSTGLGFLAGARVSAQHAGARIVLTGLNAHVRRILDNVNLRQFFEVGDDASAALVLLSQSEASTHESGKSER